MKFCGNSRRNKPQSGLFSRHYYSTAKSRKQYCFRLFAALTKVRRGQVFLLYIVLGRNEFTVLYKFDMQVMLLYRLPRNIVDGTDLR